MNILITGATGLIGKELIKKLNHNDLIQTINYLTRDTSKKIEGANAYKWDPYKKEIDSNALHNINCVIHLAGESVAQFPWTKDKKRRILESRVIPTKFLVSKLSPNIKFISASAIGYYGDRGDELLKESSSFGNSFLSEVCQKWEDAIFSADKVESYALRIGIVLSTKGGALKTMLPSFKFNAGAILGSGKQYMSWIHIDDLISQLEFMATNILHKKVYNGVSLKPVTNKEFSKKLVKVLNRKIFLKAPKFLLKSLTGDMSEIMTSSQKVLPQHFIDSDFKFEYIQLDKALTDIIKNEK